MKKILYVAENKDSAQYRYRVQNVREAMSGSKAWRVDCVLKEDLKKIEDILEGAKLVIIERQTAKDDLILNVIDLAKKKNIKVLFDLDDLIFDYGDLPLLMWSTNSKNIFYWVGYFWGIRRIAKRVDGFLVTNDFLGKKLLRSFSKPYKVIPNSLNKAQVEVSKKIVKRKDRGTFTIGYFSGSPTHAKDFRLVEPEIFGFLEEHEDARIEVVGYMEFSARAREMIKKGRMLVHEPVSYLRLMKLMSEVDVNIAPLLVNDFTNCKSELKFFEAGAVRTTTIASPAYAFRKAIKDGKNGFLAEKGEWSEKLEHIYNNRGKNEEIAEQARKDALKYYTGKEFLRLVEEAYGFFAR